jgi:hypothetical protein
MPKRRRRKTVIVVINAADLYLEPQPEDMVRCCANCGTRMVDNHCKLVCQWCGYFASCHDFL